MACTIFEGSGDPDTWIPATVPAHEPREFRLVVPKYEQPEESLVIDVCKRCDKLFATGAIHKLGDGLVFDDELGVMDKDPEKMGGPFVAGSHVPVCALLYTLARGSLDYAEGVYKEHLTLQQIRDAIRWTAEAIEGFPDQPPPKPTVGQFEAFLKRQSDYEESGGFCDLPGDDVVLAWLRHQAEAE